MAKRSQTQKIRSIKTVKNLKNKTVLVRVDFNVPLGKDRKVSATEDLRLQRTLPTIQYLTRKKAKVVLLSHLGRPKGKQKNLSLLPIKNRLEKLLRRNVNFLPDCVGELAEEVIEKMKGGEILLLENVRFYPGEQKNDSKFANQLACLGDLYVNEAFAVSHRKAASLAAITKYLPSYGGLLLEDEVRHLSALLKKPKKPLLAIFGGVKVSTKLGAINSLSKNADQVYLGGALASTVLDANGNKVGKSLVEKVLIKKSRKLLKKNNVHLPVDVIVSQSLKKSLKKRVVNFNQGDEVKANEYIVDLGPATLRELSNYIAKSKTILWNGPLGVFETISFSPGTFQVAKKIAQSKSTSIVGGGESVEVLEKLRLIHRMSFVSTGGGAMLAYLEGKTLPGLKPLFKN